MFELRRRPEWNFFAFLFLLLAPISMYLTAGMVLPHFQGEGECDLKQYYFKNRGWLFGLAASTNLLDAARAWPEVDGITDARIWSNLLGMAMFIGLAIFRRELFHATVTVLIVGLFLFFVIVARLRIA
jgi:hypothetical protein